MKDPRHHPAFPTDHHVHAEGMTLRDWFAGQALAGILAADPQRDLLRAPLSDEAYKVADAMLERRAR